MSQPITELGYLGFEVSDLSRWDQFAADVLGLGVQPGATANTRWLRMDEQHHRIILSEGPADDCAYAGWQVADAAAVDAFGRHLDSLGVGWTRGSADELVLRAVQQMLHFKDPEGNRHEVYCGMAAAATPFKSNKVPAGFVTGSGGLGHIVYEANNYPGVLDFAQQVLGLRLSDHIDLAVAPGINIEVAFFHTNERHHSFAVAPRAPVPGPKKSVHHFMVEVADVADVGRARDRCLTMGQAVVMDIGQHPNDHMISFYGQTPSGFLVEFGWGGVKVDDASWQTTRYDHMSDWGHRPAVAQAPHPLQATTAEVL